MRRCLLAGRQAHRPVVPLDDDGPRRLGRSLLRPFLGGGTGSGSAAGTNQIPVILDSADSAGNGFAALSTTYGFANVRRALPALAHLAPNLSQWYGAVRVPPDYGGNPVIIMSMVANNTLANKAAALTVGTAVVANGGAMDTAYTDEAYVNVAVPATANQRFDQSYALSTSPAAGATLNVRISRDGGAAGDTLTAQNVLIWECLFQYDTA